jgi:ribosomal protein L37E
MYLILKPNAEANCTVCGKPFIQFSPTAKACDACSFAYREVMRKVWQDKSNARRKAKRAKDLQRSATAKLP